MKHTLALPKKPKKIENQRVETPKNDNPEKQ
jgi:hypothetical protein